MAATVTVPAFFSGIRAWYTTGILVCLAVFLLFSNEVLKWPGGQPHRAGSAESDPQPVQTVRGVWSDEDHFRNFLGMQFTRIPALAHLDLEWPPDPGHPEIFAGLGWRNRTSGTVIAEQLVSRELYHRVLHGDETMDPASDDLSALPVTMVSLVDAERFCAELTRRDPDGLQYKVANMNEWTLAVYGMAMIRGGLTTDVMLQELQRRKEQSSAVAAALDSPFRPLLDDVLGDYWEWTRAQYLKPTQLEGVVSYSLIPEQAPEQMGIAVGGFHDRVFLHAHDMHIGMNDHEPESSHLRVHMEEDGVTS